MFPVNTLLITESANRSFRKRSETRHLVLHETVSQATARQQLAYFNSGSRDANAHGFIDWNEILLTLPFDEVGWHVGQPANQFTEGYELCRASNADDFAKQWVMATWWFAQRCTVYGRGADFIRSHHEIALQYGGTDHTDPDEYFAMYGKTVDDFRSDVDKILKGEVDYMLSVSDANKIIACLKASYGLIESVPGADEARKEIGRLADELRKASGQPTQNS
ncbi:peptidoglycan recognition protein family protein [Effusibacillus dendaii]|uniref:N-acetylmuramoyl-L-alanine amidase n=1 Tax=Effusibacillus dendaii TaxID=2743772 RepID=A0A7I8DBU5_9BACL|nr:peptidoglycan recognition family protein [Effusibacillus dendaii]BCJ86439.1 hypothetical protein skT53_14240 [Effusibacillus dendaii]